MKIGEIWECIETASFTMTDSAGRVHTFVSAGELVRILEIKPDELSNVRNLVYFETIKNTIYLVAGSPKFIIYFKKAD